MSDIIRTISFAPAQAHGRATVSAKLADFWGMFVQAVRVAMTRRQLVELDDRMLKDLGISRAQANFEASRSLWDLSRGR